MGGLIEAQEELGESGLAGPVFSDESQRLPGPQVQIDTTKGVALASRVSECYVLEAYSVTGL